MSRLLLVDGSNLLFQMFFGMPARITGRDGRAMQGTLGFVGALGRIRRMTQPTHMAVLFDGEHPNDRTALDGAYKANRQDYAQVPDEDSPFSQLPDICRALDFMGIRHTEIAEGETDDAIAAYAPVGSGLPSAKLDEVIGVVKAYSTCVGEGPFVCEMFGQEAEDLRTAGFEYGAKTGRPRRVGPVDVVATRYGVQAQGATNIALTKLDVLSYMDRIPVCEAYELDGKRTDEFPFPTRLGDAKPVITYMEGWKQDISGIRKWEDLPEAARKYVEYLETQIGCRIGFVSVGPERDSIILR